MKIKKYLNTTKKDVDSKKFNIFIGISLGNKSFTKEAIKEYITWALKNSKGKVVVLIADRIHAVNYEVRWGYSKERAISVALRKGKELNNLIKNVLNSLEEGRERVDIIHWTDILDETYMKRISVINKFFRENKSFHQRVINIVKENINPSIISLNKEDEENLANYPLEEIPLLVCGFTYNGVKYDLIPYPGIGKIDTLCVDLQDGKKFPTITKNLQIDSKTIILEAYPDNFEKTARAR